jgi:hypothetical protein
MHPVDASDFSEAESEVTATIVVLVHPLEYLDFSKYLYKYSGL